VVAVSVLACTLLPAYVAAALALAVRAYRHRRSREAMEAHWASVRLVTDGPPPPERDALIVQFPGTPQRQERP
jgi:hypothetical protein